MIHVEELYHSYMKDDRFAVKNVSFHVSKGEVLGFLGPSGAGKSTTQGVLTGLLPLQKGRVSVAGYDMSKPDRAMFNKIGVSFEQSNVYGKLTAIENLEFYKKLFDVPTRDSKELLTLVGLDHVADKLTEEFSKGMKHRLTFIRSMLNNPVVWFLDEPTTGLDPAIAAKIKEIITDQKNKGVTVFLTTHNMTVADQLCDRVAFIVEGEVKLIDSPGNLKLLYGENLVEIEYRAENRLISEKLSLIHEQDRLRCNALINTRQIVRMHTKEATLEEIFIKVTGRGLA